jgi:hypothetical protein
MSVDLKHPKFIPGLELAGSFFRQEVKPILDSHYPRLEYSAALIGCGSEVLGFDTEMSADHHWGPRVMLFLRPEDLEKECKAIRAILGKELPTAFRGYPTHFSDPNPDGKGVQLLQPVSSGPINHRVEMFTLADFFADYINIQIDEELEPVDWLTYRIKSCVPSQQAVCFTTISVWRLFAPVCRGIPMMFGCMSLRPDGCEFLRKST